MFVSRREEVKSFPFAGPHLRPPASHRPGLREGSRPLPPSCIPHDLVLSPAQSPLLGLLSDSTAELGILTLQLSQAAMHLHLGSWFRTEGFQCAKFLSGRSYPPWRTNRIKIIPPYPSKGTMQGKWNRRQSGLSASSVWFSEDSDTATTSKAKGLRTICITVLMEKTQTARRWKVP